MDQLSGALHTHMRHHEALMRATGGHFNLFQILGIGHYEVKTHSPILAELLNPQGRHGQGEVFLRLFLKLFGISSDDFKAEGSKVTTEYYIGRKDEESGGRIDIVIQDGLGRRILIENKIYAIDQEKQVTRYRNFDKGARLFYLTRFGYKPSNLTEAEAEKIRCEPISYKDHIRDWLIACRKEASCLPGVREMLSQYIALIEDLTHQSTTKKMNEALINEIMGSPDNLQALYVLRDTLMEVEMRIIEKLDRELEQIVSGIASELGVRKDTPAKDLDQKYSLFSFTADSLEKHRVRIAFQFSSASYCGLVFGFMKQDWKDVCPVAEDLRVRFNQVFSNHHIWESTWWAAIAAYDERYRNWSPDVFEAIRSGEFAEDVKDKLEKLVAIANEVCGSASAPTATDSGVS